MTFSDSVHDAADADGNLSQQDAKRLIRQHGHSAMDAWISLGDKSTNASALLEWLGY